MYAHIHRKIEIAKELEVTAIAWGGDNNYIACGTSDGTIKLLKLEEATYANTTNSTTTNSDTTITAMCRLQHEDQRCITKLLFDRNMNQLTSTDNSGFICVWKYNKRQQQWTADMASRRKESFVSDFCWSSHNKIGIVYRDGFCLIGNSKGQREWAKELDFELKLIEWSPNAKYFVIVTMNYECLVYVQYEKAKYKKHTSISLGFCDKLSNDALEICDIKWTQNVLCIAYKIGKLQIMSDYNDPNPILMDVDMIITKMQFNPSQTILALVGRKKINGEYTNWLCFVDCCGQSLYQLSISSTATKVNDLCWESNGSRIILSVANVMYFTQVKTNYKYAYFANSFLCYSSPNEKENKYKNKEFVYFWDTSSASNSVQKIDFKRVVDIAGVCESEYVLIAHEQHKKVYSSLYNTIGREIIKNEIKFANANMFIVTSLFAIIASKYIVYYFQHTQHEALVALTSGNISNTNLIERLFHIDNINNINNKSQNKKKYSLNDTSSNPIQSICGHKEYIIIARKYGDIVCYSMLTQRITFEINTKNQGIGRINVNYDMSRISLINKSGTFQVYDIQKKEIIIERINKMGNAIRDILWSSSDPLRFALVEKNKLIIYDNLIPENASGHKVNNNCICLFRDLEITAFNLDRLCVNPSAASNTHRAKYECKIMSKLKELLSSDGSMSTPKGGIYSAYDMIVELDASSKKKSTKLWRMLASESLKKLDCELAEHCFIQMKDYFGIQFIKRLKLIHDRNKQRAEIYSYFGNIDDAQLIYSKMNDRFEAINLYLKVGNLEKVIALLKKEKFKKHFNDKMMNNIYKQIGDYYASQFNWNESLKYYLKSKDYQNAIEAGYKCEDFRVLNQIVKQLPSSSNLLRKIANMFIVNGLTKESSNALIKSGDIETAIINCVKYNDYALAKELSTKHEQQNYFNVLIQQKITNNDDIFQVIDIYKSIDKHLEVAKLLMSHIDKLKKNNAVRNDPYLFQKLYVLSAIEIDKHRKEMLFRNNDDENENDKKAIDLLLDLDNEQNNSNQIVNLFGGQCWNGAIAYHLFILLTKQIHSANIDHNSLFICRVLTEFYDDLLNDINIYSLYAMVSYKCGYFKDCSNALTRLQYLCDQKKNNVLKNKYKKLAIAIFTKHEPINEFNEEFACKDIINDKDFNINNICMVSGEYIENSHIETESFIMCNICKHKILNQYLTKDDHFCPLCHSPL